MTEAEVIKNINALNAVCGQKDFYNEEFVEALKMGVDALEKQIAKKPSEVDEREEEDFYYLAFICPTCGGSVTGQPYRPDYCKHCGQKLDWSEV